MKYSYCPSIRNIIVFVYRPVVGVENEGMSGSPRATAKHQNAANGNNNADSDYYAQVDRSKVIY